MLPKVVMVFVWEELPNLETTEVVTKKKKFFIHIYIHTYVIVDKKDHIIPASSP